MIDSDEASRAGIGNGDDFSSSEKSSFESIDSPIALATPPASWISQWYVQGMQHINKDDIQHGYQGQQACTIFEEPRNITLGLDSAPIVWGKKTRYHLDWLSPSRKYYPALVREFCAFYTTTIMESTSKNERFLAQPRITISWFEEFLFIYLRPLSVNSYLV